MYRELNSLSKIHGKQFYDGLMTDLKKFGHRENQNPYLEYRLGREFYVNHEETLNILKHSKIIHHPPPNTVSRSSLQKYDQQ